MKKTLFNPIHGKPSHPAARVVDLGGDPRIWKNSMSETAQALVPSFTPLAQLSVDEYNVVRHSYKQKHQLSPIVKAET